MSNTGYIILNGLLLGLGLSMDAFTVSVANGLHEPDMKLPRSFLIAGAFALFQTMMPLIGYGIVRALGKLFSWIEPLIPWIAFLLLLLIGIKMILDGVRQKEEENVGRFTIGLLLLQAVATSIDALSVGFTVSQLQFYEALTEALIIGIVTFLICFLGVRLGKLIGMKLSNKASILGGAVLILVGIEILVRGLLS